MEHTMKCIRKPLAALFLTAVILSQALPASAAPYESYTYEKDTGDPLRAPTAMVPEMRISGDTFSLNAFSNPADAAVDGEGNVYLLDAGNGRVLCLNPELTSLRYILTGDGDDGNFTDAQGLFVGNGSLYIADTTRGRILRYPLPASQEEADAARAVVIEPKNLLIEGETGFKPSKLVADSQERLFIVAEGVYEGLVELAADGEFLAYVGANRVKVSFLDQIWRLFSTKKQWEASNKFVPVEFSNLCMDDEGFLFTTARGDTGDDKTIRRLNLSGSDVLRSADDEAELGDWNLPPAAKATYFGDVAAGPYGMFAGLDRTRGRVFVYDANCTLLFEFGGLSNQAGTFSNPTALLWLPDGRMAVLDRLSADLTVFRPTAYGELILSTVAYEDAGDYTASAEAYTRILTMNANSEIAYVGVGKQYFRQGNYEEAMAYFKLGNDRDSYSKAFAQHRKEALGVVIPIAIIAILTLAAICVAVSIGKGIRRLRENIRKIRAMEKR